MSSKAFGDGMKTIQHSLQVDKTMNVCESYLPKTYTKIVGASSCRCIGIAGCLCYNRRSFTWVLGGEIWLFDKVGWEAMIGGNR
jgi:hypothetical protein